MKKLFFLFILCLLVLPQVAWMTDEDPNVYLYGVTVDGDIYIHESIVDLTTKKAGNTIQVGGPFSSWELQTATLVCDPSDPDPTNPTMPGYYVLRLSNKFKMKVGKRVEFYFKVNEQTYLPGAVLKGGFEVFPDSDLKDNGQTGENHGYNLNPKVNSVMRFP